MKRIIISDLHIGSKYYKGELLIEFLREIEYDELILAGDIIDFIRVPLFNERAKKIAESIDFSKKIIYIVGNHDTPLRGLLGFDIFGMKFVDKYEFEEGCRKFRIEHGDKYGERLIHYRFVMNILSILQDSLEFFFDFNISDWLTQRKLKKRQLRRIWDILKWNNDADVFIMGHSHTPEAIVWIDENENIKTYVNSGDWVSHSSYVEIIDGIVRLRKYERKGNKT